MTNIPVSVQLDLAADAIEMAGWTQGSQGWLGFSMGGALCLEGGIMVALGMEPSETTAIETLVECPAYRAVHDYLNYNDRLYFWNDRWGRTQQEVIETLRAAAAVERVKEHTALGYETEDQPLPLDEIAA